MPSLIPGYEYDIFISYRQKDNKGEKWVSEFVDALKTELESTFKEEISVYFDISPHDGLLETHDVDESLKDKLKCLVFIPIISRTYCDPKSFAWEHEFTAFIEQAKQDQFGLKLKLPGGNVASRVLPVRIHDLDKEDIQLLEPVTGGVLRGIEFIYKSAGVNRPLRSTEEKPHDNLNKTIYRDQINKVALAVKEIISGFISVQSGRQSKSQDRKTTEEVQRAEKKFQTSFFSLSTWKLIALIIVAVTSVTAIILLYQKSLNWDFYKNRGTSDDRITMVVMPFQNLTNDSTLSILRDIIQERLIMVISTSADLKVKQASLISGFLSGKKPLNEVSLVPDHANGISQKLDADIYISGSYDKLGTGFRLNVLLNDPATGQILKSIMKEGNANDEVISRIIDSLAFEVLNYLEISKLKKEHATKFYNNINAKTLVPVYRIYLEGQKAFSKYDYLTAIERYKEALSVDSNFVDPYSMISWSYLNRGNAREARTWFQRYNRKRNPMDRIDKIDADHLYAALYGTPDDVIKALRQLEEYDDQNPWVYNDLGAVYVQLKRYDEAIEAFEKALAIYKRWDVKPFWSYNYTGLGDAYHKTGQIRKERNLYKKAEEYFPNDLALKRRQAILFLTEKDTLTANDYIQEGISICRELLWTEANIAGYVARIYSEAEVLAEAEKYYRQALCLEPESKFRKNNLAFFLINTERNVDEGLEIAEKELMQNPEDILSLQTKGWGLYKKGRYLEAYEILKRSWNERLENEGYNHEAYLHLDAARKAAAGK